MNSRHDIALLVGDNPFHGISHLSQERARVRGNDSTYADHAAELITISLDNEANGFMFSVSEQTLAILKKLREEKKINRLNLYAIIPYAFEYVRLATKVGGIPGLAKKLAKELALSGNVRAVAMGMKGILGSNPVSLMKTYLTYELSRIKSATGKGVNLKSVILHQILTDMGLALDLDWFFKSFIDFLLKRGITPGFNTGNFAYLVNKFRAWKINLSEIIVAAPFNKVGFQMIPSKHECEQVLKSLPEPNVIAISILAAGYIKPLEAIKYIATLPNIKGVCVGVSKESHASETFQLLAEKLHASTL